MATHGDAGMFARRHAKIFFKEVIHQSDVCRESLRRIDGRRKRGEEERRPTSEGHGPSVAAPTAEIPLREQEAHVEEGEEIEPLPTLMADDDVVRLESLADPVDIEYEPDEIEEPEENDEDMRLLEFQTPVMGLVKLSRDEADNAARKNAARRSNKEAAMEVVLGNDSPSIIRQLPGEYVNVLADEISGMFDEA